MKRSFLSVVLIFFLKQICGQPQKVASEFSKLSWLEGTWTRINSKPGRSGTERWMKISGTEWRGFGLSMKGTDTTLLEKLSLIVKDDHIYYVADVPENKQLVYFRLTEISEDAFTCENPRHDFPTKINYQKEGTRLKATISGNEKSVEYWFEKIK